MNEEHVLILRQPLPYQYGKPAFDTTVLARGSRQDMLARWQMADARLHAYGIAGHVIVRSADDPIVPKDTGPWRETFNASWARLAGLTGDKVSVRIYGNTYYGTVVKMTTKGAVVRFSARTRKGGWGGEAPERERPFPIMNLSQSGRGVLSVRALA